MDWNRSGKIIIGVCAIAAVGLLLFFLKTNMSQYGLKGSLQNMTDAVTAPVCGAAEGVRKGITGLFSFKQILAENEALKEEVLQLQREKNALRMTKVEKEELENLYGVFKYEAMTKQQAVAANVSALDYTGWQGVFTIDKGSRTGIREGSTVVSADGLVGKVICVSENTAKVASILAFKEKVSFRIQGEESMGILQSNGSGRLTGYLLDETKKVKKGEQLVTSGRGIYPAGLDIGRVVCTEQKKGMQSIWIQTEPAVNFFQLKKVAVIL